MGFGEVSFFAFSYQEGRCKRVQIFPTKLLLPR
jgi:hypothetical protein